MLRVRVLPNPFSITTLYNVVILNNSAITKITDLNYLSPSPTRDKLLCLVFGAHEQYTYRLCEGMKIICLHVFGKRRC